MQKYYILLGMINAQNDEYKRRLSYTFKKLTCIIHKNRRNLQLITTICLPDCNQLLLAHIKKS